MAEQQDDYQKRRPHTKYGNLKQFISELQEMGLKSGICTFYGVCRFQGEDYMYQGRCGEKTMWEILLNTNPMASSMMMTRSRVVEGKCTRSGHFGTANHINICFLTMYLDV